MRSRASTGNAWNELYDSRDDLPARHSSPAIEALRDFFKFL